MNTFRQWLESQHGPESWVSNNEDEPTPEAEPEHHPDEEPMPQGNFMLTTVTHEEVMAASSQATSLIQGYVMQSQNKQQALKNVQRMMMNAMRTKHEGIMDRFFGKKPQVPSPEPGKLFAAGQTAHVTDDQVWSAIEELAHTLQDYYRGNADLVMAHLGGILNRVEKGAGKQMMGVKPKAKNLGQEGPSLF